MTQQIIEETTSLYLLTLFKQSILKALLILIVWTELFTSTVNAQISFNWAIFGSVGTTQISSVTIGDVNNDGREDALVATTYYFDPVHDYSIFVFLQNTDGSMAEPIRYPYSPTFGTRTVVQVADVNNDSRNDVIFSYSDSLGVRFQDESGGLGAVHSFYSGKGTDGLKTGDLNNDGLTDIAVCHWDDPFIKVFYQQSSGGFSPVLYPVENAVNDEIDVNDMNGDGLDDIIFMPGEWLGTSLYVYYQDSVRGIPAVPVGYSYEHQNYQRFNGIATGDLNNDGRNDLVATMGDNEAWIALIYQKEDGTLGEATYLNSYDIPTPVEIADLNCDGKNEIIVGHNAWGFFSVWESDNVGKYSGYELFSCLYYVSPYGLAVGDLNGDLRPDVLTTQGFSVANFVYNNTTPIGTLPTDTIVKYTYLSVDTISSSIQTRPVDEIIRKNSCLIHANYEIKVTTYNTHKQSTGDSLFPRNFHSCGINQYDTLSHHFETDVNEKLYHIDTTIFSFDTLLENNHVVNTMLSYDTLVLPHQWTDIYVKLSYNVTADSIFTFIDSLKVDNFLLETVVRDITRIVYESLKCGFIFRDTATIAMPRYNTLNLKSDTTLISHNVSGKTLGISEIEKISDIRIYPNPAQNEFSIRAEGLPADEKLFSIELISLSGQSVWKTEIRAQPDLCTLVDGSKLPKGIYTVLILGKHCSGTCKVILGN